jgi:3-(3-hydroxy-phenyl)propionate hydroxylase
MTEMRDNGRQVIVVGAGPVGLATALAIRAIGLPATVLEADEKNRIRPGSRAIFVHRESLEHLDQVRPGLGWELAERGVVWRTKRTLWRGREVYRRTFPPLPADRLPPFTSLPQVEVERQLIESCYAAGVDVVWDASVNQVTANPDGVTLTTESGETWKADYVIGADGAGSTVRRFAGVSMEGPRSETSFVIVDVAEDPEKPVPSDRVFHYDHPAAGGRHVLLVPFAGGWRVDLQCHIDDDPEEFSSGDGLRSWLSRVLDDGYAERVSWVSTYRFLQVVADSFIDHERRLLLVGEAAHLFAPFGARGMNSGIADGVAAAEAVRAALEARDQEGARGALEGFARDRRQAALHNRQAAGLALAHMQGKSPLVRARRRLAVALAPYSDRAGAWLDAAPYGPRTSATASTKY